MLVEFAGCTSPFVRPMEFHSTKPNNFCGLEIVSTYITYIAIVPGSCLVQHVLLILWEELDKITPLYNMVRNYLTRKPYSTEKIKLNFENSTLMDGWDLNKEQANTTVILRKDGLYYLAIMNKKHNRVFDVKNMPTGGECYEKMEYKFFKDLTTMVPKCTTQLKDVKSHFLTNESPYVINKDVFESEFVITKEEFGLNNLLYNGKKKFQIDYLKQTGDKEGYKDALVKWIHFCLRFLSQYKSSQI